MGRIHALRAAALAAGLVLAGVALTSCGESPEEAQRSAATQALNDAKDGVYELQISLAEANDRIHSRLLSARARVCYASATIERLAAAASALADELERAAELIESRQQAAANTELATILQQSVPEAFAGWKLDIGARIAALDAEVDLALEVAGNPAGYLQRAENAYLEILVVSAKPLPWVNREARGAGAESAQARYAPLRLATVTAKTLRLTAAQAAENLTSGTRLDCLALGHATRELESLARETSSRAEALVQELGGNIELPASR